MSHPSRFSPDQRARAVRLVAEALSHYPSEWAAISSVAAKLGASPETVRKWVRQAEVDQLRRLRRAQGTPALRREGIAVGRDQTARLMRELGLAGVRHGKVRRTTVADGDPAAGPRRAELCRVPPDQPWVTDITYLRTWAGFAYLALVIDVYSRRIVGWALATHLRTELALEALEMAI